MHAALIFISETVQVSHGEGVYLVDKQGKKILDFNSQAMCSSLGHTVDPTIIEAVAEQMKSVAYVYPGYVIADIRSKLSKVHLLQHAHDNRLKPSSYWPISHQAI